MRVCNSFAPGRVELLGNHTDYNEGRVLAAALDIGVSMEGELSDDGMIRIVSEDYGKEHSVPTEGIVPSGDEPWSNYILGVYDAFRRAGHPVAAFGARFSSTVPEGAGLSSSAAIEVATGVLLRKLFSLDLPAMELVKLCREAENEFVGVSCGLLDQATSVFGRIGHMVLLDCRDESVASIPVPCGLSLLVFDSAKKHRLSGGEYNDRRLACMEAADLLGVDALRDIDMGILEERKGDLPEEIYLRAKHVVGECERVERGIVLLGAGDGEGFGGLMLESHESSRKYFANSTPELDALVEIAMGIDGVLGSRLTGGGFGGATVSLVLSGALDSASDEIAARYRERCGIDGRAIPCSIGGGAV